MENMINQDKRYEAPSFLKGYHIICLTIPFSFLPSSAFWKSFYTLDTKAIINFMEKFL